MPQMPEDDDSRSTRCLICQKLFVDGDVVLQVVEDRYPTFDRSDIVLHTYHRSCFKAGETVSSSFFSSLRKLRGYFPEKIVGEILVHGTETEVVRDRVRVTGPVGFVPTITDLERAALG